MARGRSCCRSKQGKRSNPLRSVSRLHHRRHRTRSIWRRSCKRSSRKGRPLPAFFLFMEDHRPQLMCDHPDWDVIQVAKKLGAMWHQQPCGDKEKYKKEAARLRQTHRGRGQNQKKGKKKRQSRKNSCQRDGNSLADELDGLLCC